MNLARRFTLVAILGLIGSGLIACNSCSDGSVCGRDIFITPTGIQTPTPTPVPGATPDPCRIEAVQVGFHSGAQLPFVALGATEQLDVTPVNSSGPTSKGCDVVREPVMTALTPTVCIVIGNGYGPFIRGLKVGTCSVIATMRWDNRDVISTPFTVEVR